MSADRDSVPESSSQKPLHVLTLTPFYPVQEDDAQGCFVAEPLPWLAQLGVRNTVRAARPFYRRGSASDSVVPARWVSFFSLPGGWGLSSAGAFLFASLLPEIRRLHDSHPVDLIHAHSALPCGHAASLLSRELDNTCLWSPCMGWTHFLPGKSKAVPGDGVLGYHNRFIARHAG